MEANLANLALPNPLALRILPQPCGIGLFVERTRCQRHNGLGGICFAGGQVESLQFEEKNAYYKSCSLVAIDKGMIADKASRIERSHVDNVKFGPVRIVLAWPG